MKIRNSTGKNLARTFLKAAAATLGLVVCATLFIQTARADCGSYTGAGQKPMFAPPPRRPLLTSVSYKLASWAVAARVDGNDGDRDHDTSIVGLWHVVYTATSASGPFPPTPFQFLESYKTWHADGTEFENAFLPPAGGNICFGVWKKSKKDSVKLHHIGLMFDAITGKVSNIFTVDETDTVAADGKTYTGTFDFKLFAATDVYGTGTPLAEVTGTMDATRISVSEDDD